jgi:hypothetical protein
MHASHERKKVPDSAVRHPVVYLLMLQLRNLPYLRRKEGR